MKLTDTQIKALRMASENEQSASSFRFQTIHKLMTLDLIEGVGDGENFTFWATEDGINLLDSI